MPAPYIAVRADLFRVAARFQPDDAGKGGVRGVRIEPSRAGGVILVATDGRDTIVLRDRDGCASEAATIVVPRPFIDHAKEVVKGRASRTKATAAADYRLVIEHGAATFQPDVGVTAAITVNHRPFPDWRAIVPRETATGRASFAPESIERAAVAARLLSEPLQFAGFSGVHGLFAMTIGFVLVAATPEASLWTRPLWTLAAVRSAA